jgi:membrane protease YdiL (CAAX protease family)
MPSLVGVAVCASAFVAVVLAAGAAARPSPSTVAAAGLLYIGAVAPAEELVTRGLLYGAVERHAGAPAAILVTALVFAAAHVPVYGLAALPTMLAAGLLLGWLRAWSGSLAAPVAAHALADLLALAV